MGTDGGEVLEGLRATGHDIAQGRCRCGGTRTMVPLPEPVSRFQGASRVRQLQVDGLGPAEVPTGLKTATNTYAACICCVSQSRMSCISSHGSIMPAGNGQVKPSATASCPAAPGCRS